MTGHYITNCTLGKPSHVSMDSPRNTRKGQHLDTMSSIINSVTYNLSKHLTSILTPLVCNTQHHNKNSQDFTNKVRETTLNPDEQQHKHLAQRRQMVSKRSKKKIHPSAFEQWRWPMTLPITHLQCSTEFPPQTA